MTMFTMSKKMVGQAKLVTCEIRDRVHHQSRFVVPTLAVCVTLFVVMTASAFERMIIGPGPNYRPAITNVSLHDLDRDGRQDVIVCDAQRNCVFWYRQTQSGSWQESVILSDVPAPASATVVDVNQDGDLDVLVSVLGNLFPDDGVIGSIVLVEQEDGVFRSRTILDDVRRVADVQPADFDEDGDIDFAVAVFGYARGAVLWLENLGNGTFRDHELYRAAGAIHVPVGDFDGDGDIDITTVISQFDEEVWGFENDGKGSFQARRLRFTHNFDIGSAGLIATDLDTDGDLDLLWPVGDNLEDRHGYPQPYHGCLWLENRGEWNFQVKRIATFPGTYAADAADLDGDGDQDVVLVSLVNHWDDSRAASVVWLENDGTQHFTKHRLDTAPTALITTDCGDLNGDGKIDIVAGGMHTFPPFERLGRVTAWLNQGDARSLAISKDTSNPEVAVPAEVDQVVATVPSLPPIKDLRTAQFVRLQAVHKASSQQVIDGTATQSTWLTLAEAFAAFGCAKQSEVCFRQASGLDPTSFQVLLDWANVLSRLGRLDEAIVAYGQALALADEVERDLVWYRMGLCRLRQERLIDAQRAFEASEKMPESALQLARILIREGRSQAAEPHVELVAQAHPNSIEALILQARLAEAMGDREAARQFHERSDRATESMPQPTIGISADRLAEKYGPQVLYGDIMRLAESNQVKRAEMACRQLLDAEWDAGVARSLAQIQMAYAPEESARGLRELIAKVPPRPDDILTLGDAHRRMGQWDRAHDYWQQALKVGAANRARSRILDYLQHAGESGTTAALRHESRLLHWMGLDAFRANRLPNALELLRTATEKDSTYAPTWFYMGEALRHMGQVSEATEAYQRCLSLTPEHGRAADALAHLSLLPIE